MTDWLEFGVPVLVFVGWYFLLGIALRYCGLRPLWSWSNVTPEKIAGWRHLRRWQFVVIQGLLVFPVPMLLYLATSHYVEREFDPDYLPHHHPFGTGLILMIFVGGGILAGFHGWKKIWDHKYDLPTQSER